ncbi:chemotaxis protein CheC [Carnobacterium antarcticum]|uniref:Chemotaxis protein CheC n=1 Tax=Carnobacterium antarcticum TaxID=2126436 RepID=A0ABW4NL69_9LACT|nr:chemotaxis protein CheC [Carnobacterium sp. CP1]ALV22064.1 Chemotaxis protein CheC - inhibitor of MCP methylation [Carnobacterium sp. CP1]
MNTDYSVLELDALKEIINIGGGNAATSLSQLIDKPVNMTVPIIEMLEYSELYEQIMPEDAVVKAVLTKMLGDAEGIFLFTVDEAASDSIVTMMMPDGVVATEQLADSALQELVNILVNSFLNAIIKLLDIHLITSVPLLTKDMFGAIMSSVYLEQGQYEENVMIIKNEFYYAGDRLESSLYFVPKPGILEKMFTLLGVGGE